MEQINLKTLAAILNISVSTVSRALSNKIDVNRDTRDKVRTLAKDLNFFPNPHASSLRTQSSKIIGVVVPELTNTFFTQVFNGIKACSQAHGYHVLIYISHESPEEEKAIMRFFQNGRVDGVLISVAGRAIDSEHLEGLINKQIPVVFFDRVCSGLDATKIVTNDFEASYQATRHLIQQGCRRIACLTMFPDLLLTKERIRGYCQALKDDHIPFSSKMIIECNDDEKGNIQTLKKAMSDQQPDGFFSCMDHLAIAVYRMCAEMNLSMPQDVKLISFSNQDVASLFHPAMSVISQPAYEMGFEAASMLLKQLMGSSRKAEKGTITINSELILRGSSNTKKSFAEGTLEEQL